jgi:hypothetical protein
MITYEDSVEGKPLKLHSKKFDISAEGVPEKVDGQVKLVKYKNSMPLTEELKYFLDHLNDKQISTANGAQALEVIKILVRASKQIM